MRLMCLLSLITAIILSFLVVGQSLQRSSMPITPPTTYPPRDPETLYIIFGFLIAAFAPKAVQKFAEQKLPALDPTLAYRQTPQAFAAYWPPAPVPQPPVALQPPAAPAPPAALQTPLERGTI